ncbi:hypothetical protein [Amnibacterium endophyticum]|uniref:Uncharacterized protein n=1 Tax=Amnibacterium endophyticum TaxID=2109337 RepID=A0ABW4LB84_9MICO
MTVHEPVAAPPVLRRPRRTLVVGGAGVVVGGALLVAGGLALAGLAAASGGAVVWALLALPLGALVVLAASIVLAAGLGREPGLAGMSTGARTAVVLTGVPPLLLVVVSALGFADPGATSLLLPAMQLLAVLAGAVVAGSLLHGGVLRRVVGWSFAALAVVDAFALGLSVLPAAYPVFQAVVVGVRPAVLVVVGAVLLREGRAAAHDRH